MTAAAAAAAGPASEARQRLAWEALRKSINGSINKVNTGNLVHILPELFHENLVRGRGLFCRAVLKAQMASPGFTPVYAAVIAVLNTKLPELGELLLRRIVIQFRRAYKRNNKIVAVALAKFIAHLVNQQVAHELLALQVLALLLEAPTDDSVEVAISFVKDCGALLSEVSPAGLNAVFERFRAILHEGEIDKRVQYSIEALFAVRRNKFAEYPAVVPELDVVESADQITHEVSLDDPGDTQELLDVFKYDPNYEQNEALWADIRKEILGDEEEQLGGGDTAGGSVEGGEAVTDDELAGAAVVDAADAAAGAAGLASDAAAAPPQASGGAAGTVEIMDLSETDLINLRRTIYLTIMSSVDFEECAHKLLKMKMPAGLEHELCNMLIECCSQERTYLRYYGLLGQRFCLISRGYQSCFEAAFGQQYATIHRLETNKLRNVAKFFAHLLHTDALPWSVLEYIRLNEAETTSSSRIFIKILFLELSEYMGLAKLRERLTDPFMELPFNGIMPKDDARNTRYAINFFTSIGLGALTDDLRAHLKAAPKMAAAQAAAAAAVAHAEAEIQAQEAAVRAAEEAAAAALAAAAAAEAKAARQSHRRLPRPRSRSASSHSSYSSSYTGSSTSGSYTDSGSESDSRSSYSSRSPSRDSSRGRRSRGAAGRRRTGGKRRRNDSTSVSSRSSSSSSRASDGRNKRSRGSGVTAAKPPSGGKDDAPAAKRPRVSGAEPGSKEAAAPVEPAPAGGDIPAAPRAVSATALPTTVVAAAPAGAAADEDLMREERAARQRRGSAAGASADAPAPARDRRDASESAWGGSGRDRRPRDDNAARRSSSRPRSRSRSRSQSPSRVLGKDADHRQSSRGQDRDGGRDRAGGRGIDRNDRRDDRTRDASRDRGRDRSRGRNLRSRSRSSERNSRQRRDRDRRRGRSRSR